MSQTYEVYLPVNIASKIYAHFQKEAKNKKEALGLLIGTSNEHNGEKYVQITDYITSENNASRVHVSFDREAFSNLAAQYNNTKGIIIGWAHSHPSFGCFLSSTDIQTQQDLFSEEFNIAMVVDPNRREEGFFQTRFYKLNNSNSYREASFAITRD